MKKIQSRLTALFPVFLLLAFLLTGNLFAQSSIFTTQVPFGSSNENDYELGLKFISSKEAVVTAIRYYKTSGETGLHTGRLWTATGIQLAEIEFVGETGSGWQTATLSSPVNIFTNTVYVVSVNANTEYAYTTGELTTSISNDFLSTVSDGNNGVFNETPAGFPSLSFNNSNYYRDIIAEEVNSRSLFTTQLPSGFDNDNDYELGVKFVPSQEAIVTAIRYFKSSGETGLHTGRLWTATGIQLAEIEFVGETGSGWQVATLTTPVNIFANTIYVVSVNANTEYVYTSGELTTSITNDFLSTVSDGNNGVFNETPAGFPTLSFNNTNYYRDIIAEVEFPLAPTLLSPTDLSTDISIEPALQWSAVSNAVTYSLQVSDDNLFGNLITDATGLTSTSYQLSGLGNSTQYYWKVNAENFAGTGHYSTASFTTMEAKVPILSWPIGGATVYINPPSLTWYLNTSSSGLLFDIIYSTNPDLSSPNFITDLATNSFSLNGLQLGTEYYWQVRSKTAGGDIISYSTIESFITFGIALKPVASWPSGDATVYTYAPSLYWYLNDASAGLTFEVELREGATGNLTGVATNLNITDLYLNTSGLLGGQQYSWQVRSKSGSTFSSWSDAVSFYTIEGANEPIVPTPSWPIDNANVYESSPTLNWYLGADGTGLTYEVEFVQGGVGALTGTPLFTNISSLFVSTANLVGSNTYTWRVRSRLGLVVSNWSEAETFTVVSYVNNPVVPIPSWPIGGAAVYSPTTSLNWYVGAHTSSLTFEVEYSTGSLTGNPSSININTTSFEISGLTEGATYNWSVRSTDGSTYSAWSDVETFVVSSFSGVAVVPNLSWPVGGATVYTVDPSLFWFLNSSSAGLTFDLKYSTNPDMSGSVTAANIAVTNYTLTALDQGVVYYWQVRSYDGNVFSAYSDIESFVVFTEYAPPVPRLGSPIGDITINTSSPELTWFLPTNSSVTGYVLEYSTNRNMTNAVISEVTNTLKAIEGLMPDANYFWRVRARNSDGELSNYSSKGMFNTGTVTSADYDAVTPDAFDLKQNFPNPFNPSTIINYSIPVSSFVTLKVFNILGKEVATLVNEMQNAANYSIEFNAASLPSGVYFYRLNSGDFVSVQKMILIR